MKIRRILFNIFAVLAILTIAAVIVVPKIISNINSQHEIIQTAENSSKDDTNNNSNQSNDEGNSNQDTNKNNESNIIPPDEENSATPPDEENTPTPPDEENSTTPPENNNDTPPVESDIVYAESIVLNCPETIEMPINVPLTLKEGFATTIPSEASGNISLEAGAKYTSSSTDIKLEDRTVTLLKTGNYKITVSAPYSKTKMISKIITIKGVDNPSCNLCFSECSLTVGQQYLCTDLISASGFSKISYILDDYVSSIDNKFKANMQGETNIQVKCEQDYFYLIYSKTYTIKPAPIYSIHTDEDVYETSLGQVCNIIYNVLFDNLDCAEQTVNVTINDESVAMLISCDYPYIIIVPLSVGETTIKIEYELDSNITKTITIIVT